MTHLRTSRIVAAGVAVGLLGACGAGDDADSPSADAEASIDSTVPGANDTGSDDHDDHRDDGHDHGDGEVGGDGSDDHDHDEEMADGPVELAGNRVVTTYDGGVFVLDGSSLEVVADIPIDGFLRLNPAGDDRHVLVSHGDEFLVLDSGVEAKAHDDHDHYFGYEPVLTELAFPAPHAAHVTHHHGTTALFADGTGDITMFDPYELITGDVEEVTVPSDAAHHGVAVQLSGGRLFATVGTAEERTGARVLDADGTEIARTDECPGVHGETTAEPTDGDDVVVAGCEDGVIVWSDGAFTKIDSPDDYGRIGTQKGTDTSPIVLGDYKVDPDAELERPTRVSLIDTADFTMRLVDLGSSYSWRSLARDHDDNAMVLTTDGDLTVIDVDTGQIIVEVPVVQPWEEPLEWQQPRPAIAVDGATAFVTDPATSMIHRVDLATDEVVASAELPSTPNEITTP